MNVFCKPLSSICIYLWYFYGDFISPYLIGSLQVGNRPPRWLSGKESTCNAGDESSVPGLRRSLGKENGNPLSHSCLGNPMAWWATVHGVTKELDMTERLSTARHTRHEWRWLGFFKGSLASCHCIWKEELNKKVKYCTNLILVN